MSALLVANGNLQQLWMAVPLVIAVSLVYGATRHERMRPILENAFRAAVWIVGFMAIIVVILVLVSWAI